MCLGFQPSILTVGSPTPWGSCRRRRLRGCAVLTSAYACERMLLRGTPPPPLRGTSPASGGGASKGLNSLIPTTPPATRRRSDLRCGGAWRRSVPSARSSVAPRRRAVHSRPPCARRTPASWRASLRPCRRGTIGARGSWVADASRGTVRAGRRARTSTAIANRADACTVSYALAARSRISQQKDG